MQWWLDRITDDETLIATAVAVLDEIHNETESEAEDDG